MTCKLEIHPQIALIDAKLKDGLTTYPEIMRMVRENGGPEIEKHHLSRHAMGDLHLEPRGPRKKQKIETATMDQVNIEEIIDTGMKVALWRLENKPEDVTSAALFAFLTQAMRIQEGSHKESGLDRKLAQLTNALQKPQSEN